MEPHPIVTLALLRDAAELYRQLATARRDQDRRQRRAPDLDLLAAEYDDDLAAVRRDDRHLRSEARRLEDALQQLEAKLADRRSRRAADAGTALALTAEIAALQDTRQELERQLLDLWQRNQETAQNVAREQAVADAARQRLAHERDDVLLRGRRADEAVPEIARELEHLTRRLPRQIASRLAQVARRHADPVADLRHGACAGCGQSLPPQEAVDADRETALVVCQGCGRYVVARSSRLTSE